jgi:hypothetical protein
MMMRCVAVQVGILLGLMCKYMCEECDFQIFSSPSDTHPQSNLRVELRDGTVLENVRIALEAMSTLGNGCEFPFEYLEQLIREHKKVCRLGLSAIGACIRADCFIVVVVVICCCYGTLQIDQLIVLADRHIAPGHDEMVGDSDASQVLLLCSLILLVSFFAFSLLFSEVFAFRRAVSREFCASTGRK